jgi:hypothetical protein
MSTLQNRIDQMENNLLSMKDVVDILIEEVGQERVFSRLTEVRTKRVLDGIDGAKELLKKSIESGDLVLTKKVEEGTLVVGTELDKHDKVVKPSGYVQVQFEQMRPELQSALRGKRVGAKVGIQDGSLVVKKIYKIVSKKQEHQPL